MKPKLKVNKSRITPNNRTGCKPVYYVIDHVTDGDSYLEWYTGIVYDINDQAIFVNSHLNRDWVRGDIIFTFKGIVERPEHPGIK